MTHFALLCSLTHFLRVGGGRFPDVLLAPDHVVDVELPNGTRHGCCATSCMPRRSSPNGRRQGGRWHRKRLRSFPKRSSGPLFATHLLFGKCPDHFRIPGFLLRKFSVLNHRRLLGRSLPANLWPDRETPAAPHEECMRNEN